MVEKIKYKEIYFPTDEDAYEGVRDIENTATEVVGLPYSFVIAKKTVRGRVYKIDETYWIVSRPRVGRPRVWRIEIPSFAICEVDEYARSSALTFLKRSEEEQIKMEDERNRLKREIEVLKKKIPRTGVLTEAEKEFQREVMVLSSRLKALERKMRGVRFLTCLYHSAGRRAGKLTVYGEVLNQFKKVPRGLCWRFCPQFWAIDEETGMCKVYMPIWTGEEMKRRAKTYRGMSILCLEDPWWCIYWAPELFDVEEVWRFWGVEE